MGKMWRILKWLHTGKLENRRADDLQVYLSLYENAMFNLGCRSCLYGGRCHSAYLKFKDHK